MFRSQGSAYDYLGGPSVSRVVSMWWLRILGPACEHGRGLWRVEEHVHTFDSTESTLRPLFSANPVADVQCVRRLAVRFDPPVNHGGCHRLLCRCRSSLPVGLADVTGGDVRFVTITEGRVYTFIEKGGSAGPEALGVRCTLV